MSIRTEFRAGKYDTEHFETKWHPFQMVDEKGRRVGAVVVISQIVHVHAATPSMDGQIYGTLVPFLGDHWA